MRDKQSHEGITRIASVPEGLDIDYVLEETGPCGSFQMYIQLFFMILILTIGYHGALVHFTSSEVPWKCQSFNQSTFCKNNGDQIILESNRRFSERCKLNQSEWTYHAKRNYSLISEFHLVCDYSDYATMSTAVFYIGGIIGALISGICSDFYGRKRILMLSLFFLMIASIECSLINNIWQLMIGRGFLGAAQSSSLITAFIIVIEYMAPSHRLISIGFFQAAFCVSQVILASLAYMQVNWRHLQYCASFPALLPFILIFFLSESPRWLLANKQKSSATRILKNVSKFNGNNQINIKLKYLDTYPGKRTLYPGLFRNLNVFLVTSVQCVLWLTVAMLQYYIINVVSLNLDGNIYKAFGLSTLANLPGCFAAIGTCTRYGRRKTVLVCLLITGITTALIATTKGSSDTILTCLAVVVKFLINLACTALWLWSFELFPTVFRGRGISLCISFERLGTLCVPFIIKAFKPTHSGIAHIIMSIMAIFSALIATYLPETNDLPTRETHEDFFNKPEDYQVIPP